MKKTIHGMTAEEIETLPKLGLQDTFEFRCTACGKCCKNRDDILLTPYDLFRIADDLGRTPSEVFERYCEVYEGGTSHFPVVRAVPVAPDDSCPFLYGKKCKVHNKKPIVCRVYPLGRLHMGVLDTDVGEKTETEAQYYYSGAGCNHTPRTVTVQDWVGDAASDEAIQAGKLWSHIIMTFYPILNSDKEKSVEQKESVLKVLFAGLWLNYDMKLPFLPQLAVNFEKIKGVLKD